MLASMAAVSLGGYSLRGAVARVPSGRDCCTGACNFRPTILIISTHNFKKGCRKHNKFMGFGETCPKGPRKTCSRLTAGHNASRLTKSNLKIEHWVGFGGMAGCSMIPPPPADDKAVKRTKAVSRSSFATWSWSNALGRQCGEAPTFSPEAVAHGQRAMSRKEVRLAGSGSALQEWP